MDIRPDYTNPIEISLSPPRVLDPEFEGFLRALIREEIRKVLAEAVPTTPTAQTNRTVHIPFPTIHLLPSGGNE